MSFEISVAASSRERGKKAQPGEYSSSHIPLCGQSVQLPFIEYAVGKERLYGYRCMSRAAPLRTRESKSSPPSITAGFPHPDRLSKHVARMAAAVDFQPPAKSDGR